MNYTTGFTLQDFENLLAQISKQRVTYHTMPIYVGEFTQLNWNIEFLAAKPKHQISSWYLPKRAPKILAEGRIGRKESGLRLVVYRRAWVSYTGVVKFIGPGPEHALVKHVSKRFRYELYNGTTLLLQTNSLKDALNHPFLP